MSGMMLMRLRDTARSTRLGLIDQWQGPEMSRLQTMGYLEKVGNGWRATKAAFAYLNTQRNELIKL